VIELLLNRGASIDVRDRRGATALSLAVEAGFTEAVPALLAAGANPNVQDTSGMTPLDLADEHGAHEIAAMLLRYGAKSSRELAPRQP
jgi:ankyrin repeat protein